MGAMNEMTLQDVMDELRAGTRVLLMVRHAERPKMDHDDPTFGSALPLTPAGCDMSRRFGGILRDFTDGVQFLASPLRRTVMTAEEIARGMGVPAAPIPTDGLLGNESFYFADQREVFEAFRDGGFFEKVFAYLATGSYRGFNPLHAATDALEEWALARFTARLGIFTTHDLYNGAFLHARGVKTDFTVENWIRFLDSAAILIAPDGTRRYALVRAGLSDKCTGV